MVLSDRDIKKVIREKKLVFKPALTQDQISPASVDLKLGPIFKIFNITKQNLLDIKKGLPDMILFNLSLPKRRTFYSSP